MIARALTMEHTERKPSQFLRSLIVASVIIASGVSTFIIGLALAPAGQADRAVLLSGIVSVAIMAIVSLMIITITDEG